MTAEREKKSYELGPFFAAKLIAEVRRLREGAGGHALYTLARDGPCTHMGQRYPPP